MLYSKRDRMTDRWYTLLVRGVQEGNLFPSLQNITYLDIHYLMEIATYTLSHLPDEPSQYSLLVSLLLLLISFNTKLYLPTDTVITVQTLSNAHCFLRTKLLQYKLHTLNRLPLRRVQQ
jgi:hypothetical protein